MYTFKSKNPYMNANQPKILIKWPMYGYRDLGVEKFQILHSELKEPDVERIGKFAIRLIEFKNPF